jgi:hypothetical protein
LLSFSAVYLERGLLANAIRRVIRSTKNEKHPPSHALSDDSSFPKLIHKTISRNTHIAFFSLRVSEVLTQARHIVCVTFDILTFPLSALRGGKKARKAFHPDQLRSSNNKVINISQQTTNESSLRLSNLCGIISRALNLHSAFLLVE